MDADVPVDGTRAVLEGGEDRDATAQTRVEPAREKEQILVSTSPEA